MPPEAENRAGSRLGGLLGLCLAALQVLNPLRVRVDPPDDEDVPDLVEFSPEPAQDTASETDESAGSDAAGVRAGDDPGRGAPGLARRVLLALRAARARLARTKDDAPDDGADADEADSRVESVEPTEPVQMEIPGDPADVEQTAEAAAETGREAFPARLARALRAITIRRPRRTATDDDATAGAAVSELEAEPAPPRRIKPIDALRDSVIGARDALERIDVEALPLLAGLGLDDLPTMRELEEAGTRLADEIGRRERYERAAAELEDARIAADRATARAGEAGAVAAQARDDSEAAEQEWASWLEEQGLAADLRPRAVLEAFGRIGGLRGVQSELEEQERRVEQMDTAIEEIETALQGLAGPAGLPGFEAHGAASALSDLARRRERAMVAGEAADRLHRESAASADRLESLTRNLKAAEREREDLLDQADASDGDHFRRIAERIEQRRRLAEELQQMRRASPYLSGPHVRSIESELRTTTHEAVESEKQDLQLLLDGLEEQRADLQRRLGEIDQRRQQLAGAPRTAEIQEQVGQIRASAHDNAGRWATLTLAHRLMEETIDQFRKERQPEQLKTASAYLRQFTGGRYARVRPRFDGRDGTAFEAVMDGGQVRQVSELSRATAEQLYLALRFAIIEDFGRRNGPLPVLMDDVLVNFDPVRARAACLAIARLSSRFQVLAMTCHPETVEWFQEAAHAGPDVAEVNVVELTA